MQPPMDPLGADALREYARLRVPRRHATQVVAALRGRGFVLEDIGGGDLAWRKEYRTTSKEPADLTVTILGDGPRRLLTRLRGPAFVEIENRDGGGVHFWSARAKTLLDTYGEFNVQPR